MSWAQRLAQFVTGEGAGAEDDLHPALAHLYVSLLERSQCLRAHAALAPTASSEGELSQLGDEQSGLAQLLQTKLADRGVTTPPPPAAPPSVAPNHWARVVDDWERIRADRIRLLEAARQVSDSDPQLAELVATLARGLDANLAVLHRLIARADPQALN